MVIVAHLPEPKRTAFLDRHALQDWRPLLEEARKNRYCLRPSKDPPSGWVLSAPLLAPDGTPYGALCTYGFAVTLPENVQHNAGRTIADAAAELSRQHFPAIAARARAIVAQLADSP